MSIPDTSNTAVYQLMPPLEAEERAALKEDIRHRGVAVAIEFDEDGNILDGHHRLALWQELRDEGVPLGEYDRKIVRGLDEVQKRDYVLALNLKRRHMTLEQKAFLFARLRQPPFNMTLQEIANTANVGVGTVWRHLEGLPDDVREVLAGLASVGRDGKTYPAQYQPMERIIIPSEKAERDFTSRSYVGVDESASIPTQYLVVITLASEEAQAAALEALIAQGYSCKAVMS